MHPDTADTVCHGVGGLSPGDELNGALRALKRGR